MSATDELRRLLDERGVEYVLDEEYGKKYPPEQNVTWSCDIAGEDMTVTARDYFIGDGEYCLDLEFHEVFTPEQAIVATLGAELDDATMVKLHDKMNAALIKYEQAQGIEKREGDGKDVVPFVAEMHRLLEEAATLGNDGVGRTNDGVAERGACKTANDVLRDIDRLRRDLSGYHGQLKAHNDLQRHCDNQRKRISELEGLYAKAKDENAKLRELCKKFAEYVSYDRCEGCVVKTACRNAEIDECWQRTEIRELASELGIEVDE